MLRACNVAPTLHACPAHPHARALAHREARAAGFRPSLVDWVMLHGTFERKVAANRALPLPVIGLPSAAEVTLLTHSGLQQQGAADVRLRLTSAAAAVPKQCAQRPASMRSRLWEPSTGLYQPGAAERVYQVGAFFPDWDLLHLSQFVLGTTKPCPCPQAFYWTQERLRVRVAEGGLALPAPILASLWSSLDAGLEAFEQCRYLCDTPFPAPWAQLVVVSAQLSVQGMAAVGWARSWPKLCLLALCSAGAAALPPVPAPIFGRHRHQERGTGRCVRVCCFQILEGA